ncbi:MAG: hypothetical protein Q9228_004148 [Teloschistes exilis]
MAAMFQTLLVVLGFLSFNTWAIPAPFLPRDVSPALPSQRSLQVEIGRSLSKKAALYFPGQPEYKNLTTRWADNITPNFLVTVEVGTEEDVATTVKFARKYNIDFLAINRGHGTTKTLSTVQHGIQINLRQLQEITIASDGKSAKLGGGVYNDNVVNALHAKGKSSGSGAAGCVGLMGAGLGGGYGRYEGFYGLVLDNIIDMNVVLANGTRTFVSATSNPDLYWAMRGAGHNFGIVTRLTYKIHDEISPTWYTTTMIFKQDKLEPVFNQLNKLIANGTMPARVINYALFAFNPNISTTDPVITVNIFYIGSAKDAKPYVKPFLDLKPVTTQTFTTSYPDVFYAVGTGINDFVCQEPTGSAYLYPIGLQTYNVPIMSKLFKLYSDKVKSNPNFKDSNVMLEGYSLEAVKAVDPASTAFAHRDDNILVGFLPKWAPGSNLEHEAEEWGSQARALVQSGVTNGRPYSAYINYAHGDESLEAVYGYEPWRLEKLRKLKKSWDPENKFRFYNPIH